MSRWNHLTLIPSRFLVLTFQAGLGGAKMQVFRVLTNRLLATIVLGGAKAFHVLTKRLLASSTCLQSAKADIIAANIPNNLLPTHWMNA